jgi:hypothetical protein
MTLPLIDVPKPRRRRFRFVRLALLLAVLGGLVWFCLWGGASNATYTTQPVSLAEFKSRFGDTKLDLPPSASRIYYAQSCGTLRGWTQAYRFDAPAADCIAYGNKLLDRCKAEAKKAQYPLDPDTTLLPLTTSPPPIEKAMLNQMGLSSVDWCDVETVREGFVGQECPPWSNGTFWIDSDRGRFYYFFAD